MCASIVFMKEHLKGLNDEQKEAALHTKGPLLIVAGAGAGKTKTITHRIVNLIKKGVAPEENFSGDFYQQSREGNARTNYFRN